LSYERNAHSLRAPSRRHYLSQPDPRLVMPPEQCISTHHAQEAP